MKTQQANKSEILANIKNLIKKTEIECSEEQYDKLATLVELLAKWNNALNLTAIREIDKMVVLHILDSAVVSPLISDKGKNIADVGTGAGFPGLVLAILNPQKHFTLIDSGKKEVFPNAFRYFIKPLINVTFSFFVLLLPEIVAIQSFKTASVRVFP